MIGHVSRTVEANRASVCTSKKQVPADISEDAERSVNGKYAVTLCAEDGVSGVVFNGASTNR